MAEGSDGYAAPVKRYSTERFQSRKIPGSCTTEAGTLRGVVMDQSA
jgi:hypothetical protein